MGHLIGFYFLHPFYHFAPYPLFIILFQSALPLSNFHPITSLFTDLKRETAVGGGGLGGQRGDGSNVAEHETAVGVINRS